MLWLQISHELGMTSMIHFQTYNICKGPLCPAEILSEEPLFMPCRDNWHQPLGAKAASYCHDECLVKRTTKKDNEVSRNHEMKF